MARSCSSVKESTRPVARAVGRAIDGRVVQAHQHVVLGELQVALEHVGVLLDRRVVGGEGVLGRIRARAPVRDHQRCLVTGAVVRRTRSPRHREQRARGHEDADPEHDPDDASSLSPPDHARQSKSPRFVRAQDGETSLPGRAEGEADMIPVEESTLSYTVTNVVDVALDAMRERSAMVSTHDVTDLLLDLRSSLRQTVLLEEAAAAASHQP